MSIKTSLAYYQNKSQYNILGDLSVTVRVEENPYLLPLDLLFSMAARNNKKRGFLFVSNILGKHVPVHPCTPLLSSRLLANRFVEQVYGEKPKYNNSIVDALQLNKNLIETYTEAQGSETFDLDQPMTFIGFAETATGLGHGMFDCFTNARYIHTTREELIDKDTVITFEEEHSHATSHRCYAVDECILNNEDPIVLIDDEMTTGNTTLNIIKSIQERFPRKQYYVVSLLNWMSKESNNKFKQVMDTYNIDIEPVSLLKGHIHVVGSPITNDHQVPVEKDIKNTQGTEILYHTFNTNDKLPYRSTNDEGIVNDEPYQYFTGRFGLNAEDKEGILDVTKHWGETLRGKRKGTRTLCLGTGEFMYIPMRIAAHMGEGVFYQSTTRSPIHAVVKEGYAVQNKLSFSSPSDPLLQNYMYNVSHGQYDDCFVFIERNEKQNQLQSLLDGLQKTGVKTINIVTFK